MKKWKFGRYTGRSGCQGACYVALIFAGSGGARKTRGGVPRGREKDDQLGPVMDKRGGSMKRRGEQREREKEKEEATIWPYDRPATRSFCYDLEIRGEKVGHCVVIHVHTADRYLAIVVGSLDPCWWHPSIATGRRIATGAAASTNHRVHENYGARQVTPMKGKPVTTRCVHAIYLYTPSSISF